MSARAVDAPEHRLRALRPTRDRLGKRVGIQRAVGLVGDEVAHEEQPRDERDQAAGAHEAEDAKRRRRDGRGKDDERQAPAEARAQTVRPRAHDERHPKGHQPLKADDEPNEHRRAEDVLGTTGR